MFDRQALFTCDDLVRVVVAQQWMAMIQMWLSFKALGDLDENGDPLVEEETMWRMKKHEQMRAPNLLPAVDVVAEMLGGCASDERETTMTKPTEHLKRAADFREFFAEIPDDEWSAGRYIDHAGCRCALGHLGKTVHTDTEAARRFNDICHDLTGHGAPAICDDATIYPQATPKARILAMLDDAIARGY